MWDISARPTAADSQRHVEWWFYMLGGHLGYTSEWRDRIPHPHSSRGFILPDCVWWDRRDEPAFLIECKPLGQARTGFAQVLEYAEVIGDPNRIIVTEPAPSDWDRQFGVRLGVEVLSYAELVVDALRSVPELEGSAA